MTNRLEDKLTPEALTALRHAAANRGQPPLYSWDVACVRGLSYQGYGLDELLLRLLLQESARYCAQCGAGDCTHEAARLVLLEYADVVRGVRLELTESRVTTTAPSERPRYSSR